jgi:DNA-binding CsgD family transcriptional regulator
VGRDRLQGDDLAAAEGFEEVRTRALSAEQIRDRLGERFDLLTGGSRAALPRHQTLRTAIEWSYDLLTPAERTLLTRLCVFAGRFTLEDVAAVCGWDDGAAGARARAPVLVGRQVAGDQGGGRRSGARIHVGLAQALDRSDRSARAGLGPAGFASDYATGQHLSRQMASRLALGESAPTAARAAVDRGSSGALSRRGAEVAQLIAEGLTNREIGARLFISERTVESHVRTVLNTLGFTSGAQIAGWVASGD